MVTRGSDETECTPNFAEKTSAELSSEKAVRVES
jgi:hypothetical protein